MLTSLFALTPVLTSLFPSLLPIVLFASGLGWALVNVSAYARVADLGGTTRIGFFTGMYYLFSMAGAVLGPGLIGLGMDALGVSALFWGSALTFFLAAGLLAYAVRP